MTKVVVKRGRKMLGPLGEVGRDAHARLELLARGLHDVRVEADAGHDEEGPSLATVEADPTDVDVLVAATGGHRHGRFQGVRGSRRLRASRFPVPAGSSPMGIVVPLRTSATAHRAVPAHRADEVDALPSAALVWPSPGSSAVVSSTRGSAQS